MRVAPVGNFLRAHCFGWTSIVFRIFLCVRLFLCHRSTVIVVGDSSCIFLFLFSLECCQYRYEYGSCLQLYTGSHQPCSPLRLVGIEPARFDGAICLCAVFGHADAKEGSVMRTRTARLHAAHAVHCNSCLVIRDTTVLVIVCAGGSHPECQEAHRGVSWVCPAGGTRQ